MILKRMNNFIKQNYSCSITNFSKIKEISVVTKLSSIVRTTKHKCFRHVVSMASSISKENVLFLRNSQRLSRDTFPITFLIIAHFVRSKVIFFAINESGHCFGNT